jgi:hypothetical protein
VDVSATAVARAEAPQLFAIARQADATALTLSLFRAAGVQAHPLPAAVSAALAAYDDESAERVRALAGAVWAAVSGAAE